MDSDNFTFVFVNKDQLSTVLTRAEGSEKATVQSHSQSLRRRREKLKDQPNLLTGIYSRLTFDEPLPPKKPRKPRKRSTTETKSDAFILSPSKNATDPFNSTVAGTDINNHAILQYISEQAAKMAFLAEAYAPSKVITKNTYMRHDKAIKYRLQTCVEDKALMYSTLACGTRLMAWLGGVVDLDQRQEYFTGEALQAVRLRLSDPGRSKYDKYLAMSICSLAIADLSDITPRQRSDSQSPASQAQEPRATASRTHLKALLDLVNDSGGWDVFGQYLMESTILLDKYMAIWEWTKPLMPLTWAPRPPSREVREAIRLPDGSMGQSLMDSSICDELKLIIRDVIDYVDSATNVWCYTNLPTDIQSRLFLQHQHLQHRLLALRHLVGVDGCVCLTALIFLISTTEYRGAQLVTAALVPRLRSALVSSRFWEGGFDSGIRFWCLATAALTGETFADRDWFVSMLVRYPGDVVPFTIEVAKEVMRRYIFLPDRQEASLLASMQSSNS